MAKERVQVQGLGGAVPGIQPTIQRAGQYSVAQVRAPRNKLMDLADALGQVNPVLQQYTQVADIEAEQFEDELSRKSPEEIQAILQKTEGEFDKLTRKGAISWLTSPINQKRKLEAIGKLASRDLLSEVENRLINPQQNDPEDLVERANLVRQEFIDKTPALQSSFIAQQGLDVSTQNRIRETVANYERQESVQARQESIYTTGSSMYDKVFNLLDTDNEQIREKLIRGDFNFEIDRDASGNIITLGDSLMRDWGGTNAHTPKEQRDLLASVLNRMASTDEMEDQADGLLLWAKGNLKFGTAKMSEMEYNRLQDIIDKGAELAEDRREEDKQDYIKNFSGSFKTNLTKIKLDKQTTIKDQTFDNKGDLAEYYRREIINNTDLTEAERGDLLSEIDRIQTDDLRDADTYTKTLITNAATIAHPRSVNSNLQNLFQTVSINYPDLANKPEIIEYQNRKAAEINLLIANKRDEFLGLPTEEAAQQLDAFATTLLTENTNKITADLKTLFTELEDKQPKTVVPPEKPEVFQPVNLEEEPEELLRAAVDPGGWYSMVSSDPKDENSNKAKQYIKKYIPDLANEFARLSYNTNRYVGIGAPMTHEEARQRHIDSIRLMDGVFTLDVLENLDENGFARTYAGIPFKPRELIGDPNIDKFVLLSEEQIDNAETEEGKQIIERIKEATGIKTEFFEFIRVQKLVRKRGIVPYKPFPDSYRPLTDEEKIQELIDSKGTSDFDPLPDFLLID
jgi:hypothetical protein